MRRKTISHPPVSHLLQMGKYVRTPDKREPGTKVNMRPEDRHTRFLETRPVSHQLVGLPCLENHLRTGLRTVVA